MVDTTHPVETLQRPVVRRAVVAGLAAVAVAAIGGSALGVKSMLSEPTQISLPTVVHDAPHKPAEDVPTSFGVFAVEIVDKSAGLSNKAVAGNSHYPGHVSADQMRVQVTINVTNRLPQAFDHKAGNFVLRSGTSTVRFDQVSNPDVRLQPHASVNQILSFQVPRKNQKLALLFDDPGASGQAVVDLGRATAAVEPAGEIAGDDTHDHR